MTSTSTRTRAKTAAPETPSPEPSTSQEPGTEENPVTDASTTTPDADDWGALMQAASLADRDITKHRPVVDVPANVVLFVQERLKDGMAAYIPVVDIDDYKKRKLVLQAAGDHTTPRCSATVTPADADRKPANGDGWETRVKFLRVTVGERRGAKGAKNKKDEPK